ncbi:ABC transporter substrate-binding protein [Thauera sp.]|jgi:NitT/TauT family transport system substrate-binding protein|uniref:ABC transporter substrate-binding protein n=1 Tax=Thauera sp. TaxID=1905334 RepID=UPI002A36B643|nr:ABC transporter substrate-binding protein [Thauera sp.]MDX9885774.1 ABC transporter substrate-binding protein [Thauera sp.]
MPHTLFNRRESLRTLLSLLCLPALAACSPPAAPLSVSAHPWPGYELMFLAAREGWIDERSVQLRESVSATESMQRLRAGTIDAAALTLDETITLLAEGVDLRVVLVFNVSSGADALVAKPHVRSLQDLRGRRVGVEDSAVGALMLHAALATAGMSRSDVIATPLTFDQHLAAWTQGKVDAVVSFEPVRGMLLRKHGRVLFDSTGLPDTIIDVLAVSAQTMADKNKRRALRLLIDGHFLALRHLRTNPADAAYRLAVRLGDSGPAALQSYRGLILPDEHANRRLLDAQGQLHQSVKTLSAMMLEWGQIARAPQLDRLIDASLLPHAEVPAR